MTTLSSYLSISNNRARWQTLTSNEPATALATKYFDDNISKVTSASDLVNDPRLFKYAMSAFGLSDMAYAKGMMLKVLQQGTSSSSDLAHTLNNSNILAFAKAFNFTANGATTTSSSTLVDSVVSKYAENELETEQGQQDPGVQMALYFQQHAPEVNSIYGILADKTLLSVVQTALGISPSTSAEPVDQQYALLSSKLSVTDLQDPEKLNTFVERFAAMYDSTTGGSDSGVSASVAGSNAILESAFGANSDGMVTIDLSLVTQFTNGKLGL